MSTLDYYNANAQHFVSGSINADMAAHYSRFLKMVPKNGSILDLGCGSGRDTARFRELGYIVTPVDGSIEICRLAEEFLHIPVRCMSFDELDYSECFDAVWACASLLHVSRKDIGSILDLIKNALKEHGVLYSSFKYGTEETTKDGRLFNNYTEESIERLFTAQRWIIIDQWISSDVRLGRQEEKWINVIARNA